MTNTTYEVHPIYPADLERFRRTDDAGRTTKPYTATESGSPLRCCLRRIEAGEEIALVSYAPLARWVAETGADPGAYNELGPVFIHAEDCGGPAQPGYPEGLYGRRVLRSYDAEGHILGGRLVETDAAIDTVVAEQLADPDVALIHVRAVEYGCYLFELRRAGATGA